MKYTIGEVSKLRNIPISTIRYYDKEGLLPYVERKETGYRVFDDNDLQMLSWIEVFRKIGMSIKDIRQFVNLEKQGDSTLQQRQDMLIEQKHRIEAQMNELSKELELLNSRLTYYKEQVEKQKDGNL